MRAEPFSIHMAEEVLDDLRARIRAARLPPAAPGAAWERGTDLEFLRELLADWAAFDWRARERWLNGFAHFRAAGVHFVHERAVDGRGIPLVLTHGWPSTFAESLALVPLLTDPAAHGIDGPAFDVVIPSLPGYGFSERPARCTTRDTARLWHELMRGLGYERYGAQGGDFGASVTTWMALEDPAALLGIHLHNLDDTPYTGPGSRPLSDAERAYRADVARWDAVERGYSSIQSTKPQTVAFGLNDSPAGLAAWIAEKWRSWSDAPGIPRELLLTTLTLFWATQTIATSMRDYYDMRWHGSPLGPGDRVPVPTAIAVFDRMLVPEGTPPREWAERLYDVRRWTPMPRGGHFAPAEQPELLARDVAAFFAAL